MVDNWTTHFEEHKSNWIISDPQMNDKQITKNPWTKNYPPKTSSSSSLHLQVSNRLGADGVRPTRVPGDPGGRRVTAAGGKGPKGPGGGSDAVGGEGGKEE